MNSAIENMEFDTDALLANSTALAIAGASLLVFTLVWCRIFARTGRHGATGLLMLVPGVNLLMLFVLAFGSWPVEREVKGLRHFKKAARKAESLSPSKRAA